MDIIFDVYDPKCKAPPYKMIEIRRCKVSKYKIPEMGHYFFLRQLANKFGYHMRFYTYHDDSIVVTVHNMNSPGSECYLIDHLKENPTN